MSRPRTIAVFTVCLVAPLWLATSHPSWGARWRVSILSLARRPLVAVREMAAGVAGVVRAPALRLENQRLRHELLTRQHDAVRLEELSHEVTRLQRLLQLKQVVDVPTVAVRVIGRDATPWFRTLLVDVGRRAGLVEGRAVLVEHGLVGQLFEVGADVSRVIEVRDPRFRVGAVVQRSRAQGLVLGSVTGQCHLVYLTAVDAAQVGDAVLTSGVGGMIPKGLVIGSVIRVERDPSGLYWRALVNPAVDTTRWEEVLCMQ